MHLVVLVHSGVFRLLLLLLLLFFLLHDPFDELFLVFLDLVDGRCGLGLQVNGEDGLLDAGPVGAHLS